MQDDRLTTYDVTGDAPEFLETLEIPDLEGGEILLAGDTVVVCGKGHEQSLCYIKTEYAWDDREAMRFAICGEAMPLGPAV